MNTIIDNPLILNSIQTPDGTILQSTHVHDFVGHVDQVDKSYYAVDGGLDYLRRTGDFKKVKELSLSCWNNIEIIRNRVKWGRNFNAQGIRLTETEWILIKDIADDHLDAILQHSLISDRFKIVFLKEKQFRNLTQEEL